MNSNAVPFISFPRGTDKSSQLRRRLDHAFSGPLPAAGGGFSNTAASFKDKFCARLVARGSTRAAAGADIARPRISGIRTAGHSMNLGAAALVATAATELERRNHCSDIDLFILSRHRRNYPSSLCCPITQDLPSHAVGFVDDPHQRMFDEEALRRWEARSGTHPLSRDPLLGKSLRCLEAKKNGELAELFDAVARRHNELFSPFRANEARRQASNFRERALRLPVPVPRLTGPDVPFPDGSGSIPLLDIVESVERWPVERMMLRLVLLRRRPRVTEHLLRLFSELKIAMASLDTCALFVGAPTFPYQSPDLWVYGEFAHARTFVLSFNLAIQIEDERILRDVS